jgi:hypothetical protein
MTDHRPAWVPSDVDMERPSAARMYDYYLGGSHNLPADQELAEETIRAWPDVRHLAHANRAFLRRAVTFLAEAGVDQFLDLGSGIPTRDSAHQVAARVNPAARTMYVDVDPVTVGHGRALLAQEPLAGVVAADLRSPEAVLGLPEVRGFLDLGRPVAVLMLAVLPFVAEADHPAEIVAGYREGTAPGSYLAISHGTADYRPAQIRKVEDVYNQSSNSIALRSRRRLQELLQGYELVAPGLVDMIHWRPDGDGRADPLGGDVARYSMLAAVGRRD